ncbi:hypothetical protein [Actibacterium lipolyticum]|uniref:Uncharacterized protein n=1 Tax=Actibacterium lipolyticum TaxID=1524263 RepID=A0A238KN41_9RHOB|nr:hypothetical protein [Actibacterium lipolyticum]SMX44185.1 hypothetical protein COL8621_02493 [Actibacterium lipolyticum]
MTHPNAKRGGAPVGLLTELPDVEAGAVLYLRLWCEGAVSQAQVSDDFALALGMDHGRRALAAFEQLCDLCVRHGRRPLVRHQVTCKCLGADESCFANFISAAADGQREDAMLIATLLVRADVAPSLTALAEDVGIALKRMVHRPGAPQPAYEQRPTLLH